MQLIINGRFRTAAILLVSYIKTSDGEGARGNDLRTKSETYLDHVTNEFTSTQVLVIRGEIRGSPDTVAATTGC